MDPHILLTSAPVSPPRITVAWLRAVVARFSSGEDHARRRALVLEELAKLPPQALSQAAAAQPHRTPAAILAQALGYDIDPVDVAEVAKAYQPHFPQTAEADEACARLVRALGGPDERTAAKVSILVQAEDATKALIEHTRAGNPNPPVPATRRWVDGREVIVDLTDYPFGAGPRACPGEAHARALAEGAVGGWRADGVPSQ